MSWLFGSNRPQTQYWGGEQFLQPGADHAAWNIQMLLNQPYQPFPGPRVAPFNQDQLDAMQMTRDMQGQTWEQMQEAMDITRGAMGPITEDQINQYWDPYVDQVADNTANEMQRMADVRAKDIDSQAALSGAFGGSRQAIEQSEHQRNTQDAIGRMYAEQYSQAWNTGLGAAQADAMRQMQGGAQMANQAFMGQQAQYMDIGNLGHMGDAQQRQVQRNYDTAYQDWQAQQMWPYFQTDWASQNINQLRTPGGGYGYQSQPNDGYFNELLGMGLLGLGLFG